MTARIYHIPQIRVQMTHGLHNGQCGTLIAWRLLGPHQMARCVVAIDGEVVPREYPRGIMRVLSADTAEEVAA